MSQADEACRCGRIAVGMTVTNNRNWNGDCPEHGLTSAWWNSPAQVARRQKQNAELRDLYQQARQAREAAKIE